MSKAEKSKSEDQIKKSVISVNDFGLDKCPKCKKTVCNHTSVANFHALLRGDEDISIYSSDFAFKFRNDKFSEYDDDLNIYIDDDEYSRQSVLNNSVPYVTNVRPISCNVVVIDRNNNNNNNNGESIKNSLSQRFYISRKSYNELIMGNGILNDESDSNNNSSSSTNSDEDNTTIRTVTKNNNIVLLKSSNIESKNGQSSYLKESLASNPHFSRMASVKSLFIFPDYLSKNYRKDVRFSYFNAPNHYNNNNQLICKLLNADDQDTSSSSTSEKKYRTLKLSNTSSSTNTGEQQPLVASYHSISMILIILLLYTINILQEFFILFDYFNTKKYYWCLFSVLFLTISQFFRQT